MPWIESHLEIQNHPKLLDLMNRLSWKKREAIGLLHLLWWWCLAYCPDGNLTRHPKEHLTLALELGPIEGTKVINALIQSGWLDEKPYFRVHDWWNYVGQYLRIKFKNDPAKWKRVQKLYRSGAGRCKGYISGGKTSLNHDLPTLTNMTNQQNSFPEEILKEWNEFAQTHGLAIVLELSDQRKKQIERRVREKHFDFPKILEAIAKSPWLLGEGPDKWKVGLDWIISSTTHYLKIREGQYTKDQAKKRTRSAITVAEEQAGVKKLLHEIGGDAKQPAESPEKSESQSPQHAANELNPESQVDKG